MPEEISEEEPSTATGSATTEPQESSIPTIQRGEFDEARNEIDSLKKDMGDLGEEVAKSKKDVDRTDKIMYFVLIFFAVSFVVAVFLIYWDGILSNKLDKDLYFQYNEFYKEFFDQNFELKNQIYEQKIEINNLRNELELLRTKNYLK